MALYTFGDDDTMEDVIMDIDIRHSNWREVERLLDEYKLKDAEEGYNIDGWEEFLIEKGYEVKKLKAIPLYF
jgi:hypothetical protein